MEHSFSLFINTIEHNASVQHRKWFPDRKWSTMRTSNDPTGKRGIAWSYYYYLFIYLFIYLYIVSFIVFIYLFIYFSKSNDTLNKCKGKMLTRYKTITLIKYNS